MRLALYASTPRASEPSYVSVQDPSFSELLTVMVCPMRRRLEEGPFRVTIEWTGSKYVVATELTRHVDRTILRPFGELDEESSQRVLETFLRLFPHDP